jgi:hypothetical protein
MNSDQTEICLSCEYPIAGRVSTNWLKRVAIGLAILLGVPLIVAALTILQPPQPPTSPQLPTSGSNL